MKTRPIGVFDSGVGGITVLDELIKMLPNEDFIYIADEEKCPYGTKPLEEIKQIISRIVNYLIKQNVKAIVIACNTASLFVNDLRKRTSIPIIDVIKPTSNYAISKTKNNNIGVIATNATINKGKYQEILKENNINVYPVACSEFVDFIETKDLNSSYGKTLVKEKLKDLKKTNIDTLIYGCTHFSIIESLIKEELGNNITYIACGYPTSINLYETLKTNNLLNDSNNNQKVDIYTTGNIEKTNKACSWYPKKLEFKKIDI